MIGFLLLPMYYVYILYSPKCDRYYVGYCADIAARLQRHNAGMVTATHNCRPYILQGNKSFQTETEARKEEARIKKQKSRKYIEWLLEGNWQTRPDLNRGPGHTFFPSDSLHRPIWYRQAGLGLLYQATAGSSLRTGLCSETRLRISRCQNTRW